MTSNTFTWTFSGLKVLDLSNETAEMASRLLGDVGADVVKVETPDGSPSRRLGPFRGCKSDPEQSLSFWYRNQNKRGLKLDFNKRADLKTLRDLAANADVLVETCKPGYLAQYGLDYASLSKPNPGLIYASVTGFGQTGPYRDFKSTDIVAAASGGQMFICGAPETSPLKHYGQQSYNVTSFFTTIGLQLAIWERRRSGRGQWLDISLQEAVAATIDHVLPRYNFMERGQVPHRIADYHWTGAFAVVPCNTGKLLVSPIFERPTLAELIRVESNFTDLDHPKWDDQQYVREHMKDALEQVIPWSTRHDADELFEMGQLMHIPWAKVCSIKDIVDCEHLKERKFFVDVSHGDEIGDVKYPGDLGRFGRIPQRHQRAPRLGEHNNEIEEIISRWSASSVKPQPGAKATGDILKGVRILDFSRVLAGPYATRMLSDFGAEILKVQSASINNGVEHNDNGYFYNWNRNKRSITLNMHNPKTRELVLKIVPHCDVVLENFTPRVMENWGLQYEELKKVKPDIIMVSLSGMGQNGPWRDFAAFGPTIESLTGITAMTAFNKDRPLGTGYAFSDHVGGIVGAWSILNALEHKARTGEGQYVDMSEHEAMCTMMGTALLDGTVNGGTLGPAGNDPEWDENAFYGCYACPGKERWAVIAVTNDDEWHKLAEIVAPGSRLAEKYPAAADRRANAAAIHEIIGKWARRQSPRKIFLTLQEAGVPAAPVNNARDLTRDPHLKDRNFFIPGHHHALGNTKFEASPIRFSRTPARKPQNAPRFGDNNDYVFKELLGLTQEEIDTLIAARVIG